MSYRYLTDLDQALNAWGIPFVEVGYSDLSPEGAADWRSRGRPESIGPFDPTGIVCHHTAAPQSATPQSSLNCILAGNSSAPGPISQLFLSREPILYLVAAGRANHAGGGIRPGKDGDCEDMNEVCLGIEVDNDGVGERWGDEQTTIYATVVAALSEWYGWDLESVYLHNTTGPPSGGCNSKIDPAGPWQRQPELVGSTTWSLDVWRQFCAEQGGGLPPPTPTPGGDDVIVIYRSIDAAGNRWAWADFMGSQDANGLALSVEWLTGPEMAEFQAAAASGGNAIPEINRGPGGYKTFRLEGRGVDVINTQDQQHQWSIAADFRC